MSDAVGAWRVASWRDPAWPLRAARSGPKKPTISKQRTENRPVLINSLWRDSATILTGELQSSHRLLRTPYSVEISGYRVDRRMKDPPGKSQRASAYLSYEIVDTRWRACASHIQLLFINLLVFLQTCGRDGVYRVYRFKASNL